MDPPQVFLVYLASLCFLWLAVKLGGLATLAMYIFLNPLKSSKSPKPQKEKKIMTGSHNPIQPVPKDTKKGWRWIINGIETNVNSIVATNPWVGQLLYGYNGRFDQPAIEQNPGRLVVYVTQHPVFGLLMGGANEPRVLANGEMFTPAGGFDSTKDTTELQKIQAMTNEEEKATALTEYGKRAAAREALEEMGLDVTNLELAGHFVSNRAFFIVNLEEKETWNAESVYICPIDPDLLGDDLTIDLPEDKLGDVMPAPEWSGVQKLQFKPFLDCLATEDGVALSAFAKAYRWFMLNQIK